MIASRCWAEISLGALARNYRRLRAAAAGQEILCVVKANAYGHGAAQVAARLELEGAARFAVATVAEGVELRATGIHGEILVLGGFLDFEMEALFDSRLTPVVHDLKQLAELNRQAAARALHWPFHLKIDTGMGRMGALAPAAEIASAIGSCPQLRFEGLMSHLATTAATLTPQTAEQFRRFEETSAELMRLGAAAPTLHCAASVPVVSGYSAPGANLVRPGLALYGYSSTMVEPVLSWRARILLVKEIAAGDPVGYGARWRAPRPSRIAVLACGYADGVPYRLEGAEVLIAGRRAPVAGAVSMDLLTVDVTDCPVPRPGDAATLIGTDGGQRLTAEDWAGWSATIPYVVLCSLSRRVVRLYSE